MMTKPVSFSLTLMLALGLAACGGGGGGGTPTSSTPGTVLPTISVVIPASSYPVGSAELGGWTVLQQARKLCGFGTLQQDPRLDRAAVAHAKYLVNKSFASATSVLSHYERNVNNLPDSGNPDYTGEYPWDRTSYQGYGNQVAEILEATVWDYDINNPPVFPTMEQRGAYSMLSLMNSVYHLTGAMYDGRDVGFGVHIATQATGSARREEYRFGSLNGYQTSVIKLGTGNVATYPCQGSSDIPSTFDPSYETPNPFPSMTTMGPPIYLKVDRGQILTISSRSIVSQYGAAVPTTLLTHANDPNIDPNGQRYVETHEAFVVPTSALSPFTTYQVDLAGTIDGVGFSRSFTMSTGQ